MDSDETTLQNALNILRQRHGAQLPGPQQRGVSEMRNTLTQGLGFDTAVVHNILNNLTRTNRLEYVSDAKGDALPGAEGTGPVISMPLTQSADGGTPLITTASPGMIMGIVNEPGGVGEIVESDAESSPEPASIGEHEDGERTGGYWRIG